MKIVIQAYAVIIMMGCAVFMKPVRGMRPDYGSYPSPHVVYMAREPESHCPTAVGAALIGCTTGATIFATLPLWAPQAPAWLSIGAGIIAAACCMTGCKSIQRGMAS